MSAKEEQQLAAKIPGGPMPGLPYGESIGYATREKLSASAPSPSRSNSSSRVSVCCWTVEGWGWRRRRWWLWSDRTPQVPRSTRLADPPPGGVHTPGAAPHSSRLHCSSE